MRRPFAICAAWLLIFSAILLVAACQPQPVVSAPGADVPEQGNSRQARVAIYVASNGWHSAIVVPRAALPPGALPEAGDFPNAAYLSFGWGDAAYFPAPDPGLGVTFRAIVKPTPAVLHLAGLASHPRQVFPADEVVELTATARQFEALVAFLDATFDRAGAARAPAIAPGLHRFSLFYRAKGEFHLFNTCNTWTARGLAAGGWPIRVSGTVTAEDLMTQVRALAERKASNNDAEQREN
jgi:uncharacterized protein (TIGR02117 family)